MGLWKCYIRWRHSKGFGVHSPYAFRFVSDVLRPGPYRYYSYQEVEDLLFEKEYKNHKFLRLIRFTIRLAIFLKTKRIVAIGNNIRFVEVAAQALKIEYLHIEQNEFFSFSKGDLLVVSQDLKLSYSPPPSHTLLETAIKNFIPVFTLNPDSDIRTLMEQPISKGLLLSSRQRIILIPRKEMEYVAYEINLEPFNFI